MQEHADAPEIVTCVRSRWYVLVTSASGNGVFATMGPYPNEAGAKSAADVARVVHYRVGEARFVGGHSSTLRRFG